MHCGTTFETSPPPIPWYWDHLEFYAPASRDYPTVKGTQWTADMVARLASAGYSHPSFQETYTLTPIEVTACVDWARDNS